MTTHVEVRACNYPVLVTITDRFVDSRGEPVTYTHEEVLVPEMGVKMYHATTTRTVSAVDLEYNDPRVKTLQQT